MTDPKPTLREIGEQARAHAQELLDAAREGMKATEAALAEAASTPLFGNGLAGAMRTARDKAGTLDETIVALKTQLDNHFRADVPDTDRSAAIRGEP